MPKIDAMDVDMELILAADGDGKSSGGEEKSVDEDVSPDSIAGSEASVGDHGEVSIPKS